MTTATSRSSSPSKSPTAIPNGPSPDGNNTGAAKSPAPFSATLTYPVNSGAAFPGLAKARLTAKFKKDGTIADLAKIKLTVSPQTPRPDDQREVEITVDVDQESKGAFRAIRENDTTGKKDLFVVLGFEGGEGAEPQITGEIKVEKKPSN